MSISTAIHTVGTAENGLGLQTWVANQGGGCLYSVWHTGEKLQPSCLRDNMFSMMTLTQLYHDVHYLLKR